MSEPAVDDVQRSPAMPPEGVIPPFDAGWEAHALGLERRTVEVLAADPRWAVLGWDCREMVANTS